jgi:DNA-directed RNA polymerase subunit H
MVEEESNDVSAHVLVPKHEVLSEEQAEEVLKQYKISKKQLPSILKKDAALKMFDVNEGDVIRIHRKSPTIGQVFYYRVVVNG